jgi:PAS domain S-box-containing protein
MKRSGTSTETATQNLLYENEARYRLLTESLPQYVWTTDADGKIDYCNRHFLEYCGLTMEEVQAGRVLEFVHPEDVAGLMEKVERSRAADGPFEHEYRVRRSGDGEYRWHFAHSEPFSDSGGGKRWLGIAMDVTSRKQAEFELRDANERMNGILGSISEWFIALDREWRVRFVSQRVLDFTHRDWSDLEGRVLWDVFPEAAKTEYKAGYEKVMGERVAHTFDVNYPLPDGTIGQYRVHAYPTPNGIAALISEASDRNRTEVVRNRLAAIVDSSDDAIISKDLNGIVTSWNLGATQLFGYRAEEMVGKSILTIIPPELQGEEPAILASLRSGKKIDHHETVRIRKDGTRVAVSLTISPVRDSAGQVVGASKIARDISERLRMQEAMIQSEKLAATGRMAAAIAHEINNPLEAVTNLAYLLSTDPTLNDTARNYAERLLEEINRVSDVAKQSLGFFRDNKKPGSFDVCALLDNVVSLYRPLLDRRNLRLDRDYAGSCRVFGSSSEIRQVFANLLRNAIEAVEPGGVIQLRVRTTRTGMRRILVADNGRGISPQTRSRLFQPFVTSKGTAGNGLGLWVSHGIVAKHGGRIEVRTCDIPGRSGTVFAVTLPADSGERSQEAGPGAPAIFAISRRMAS